MTAHTDPTPDPTTTPTPDKREALDVERLPERFRFSREVYGDVADDATWVLLAVTDGGHGIVPDDNLRWIAITAAQALAARPAPTVNAGPLRVEYGVVWDDLGSADTFPTLEQARSAARELDEPAQVVRIETWPVADKEGQE